MQVGKNHEFQWLHCKCFNAAALCNQASLCKLKCQVLNVSDHGLNQLEKLDFLHSFLIITILYISVVLLTLKCYKGKALGRKGSALGTASKPNLQLTGGSVRFCVVAIFLNNYSCPKPHGTAGQLLVEFWSRALPICVFFFFFCLLAEKTCGQ